MKFGYAHRISIVQCMEHQSCRQVCLLAGESARHCEKLQHLLMLVPGLADVSTATIRAALQRVDIPALSDEAHIRHLEAVGALIQQLCQAETAPVGSGHQNCALSMQHSACSSSVLLLLLYPAAAAAVLHIPLHCLEETVLEGCE